MTTVSPARDPARNVWLQLGLPNAEEHHLKAELILRLSKAIEKFGLTQREAARQIGATQPELSKILHGTASGPIGRRSGTTPTESGTPASSAP